MNLQRVYLFQFNHGMALWVSELATTLQGNILSERRRAVVRRMRRCLLCQVAVKRDIAACCLMQPGLASDHRYPIGTTPSLTSLRR